LGKEHYLAIKLYKKTKPCMQSSQETDWAYFATAKVSTRL